MTWDLVERLCRGGGEGSPMSLVWILKRLVSVLINAWIVPLSEIERKFFVFVGILAKGDSDAL